MTNKVKDIGLEKTCILLFNDIINRKIFDPNDIKLDEKLSNNIIYYIGSVTIKDFKYLEINSVNLLQLIFRKWMDTLKKIMKLII